MRSILWAKDSREMITESKYQERFSHLNEVHSTSAEDVAIGGKAIADHEASLFPRKQ